MLDYEEVSKSILHLVEDIEDNKVVSKSLEISLGLLIVRQCKRIR